jgi:hypothetical protein
VKWKKKLKGKAPCTTNCAQSVAHVSVPEIKWSYTGVKKEKAKSEIDEKDKIGLGGARY